VESAATPVAAFESGGHGRRTPKLGYDHGVWVTAIVIATTFGVMLLFERLAPLRPTVEPKPRRLARNFTMAGLSLLVGELVRLPLLVPVILWTSEQRIGLVNLVAMPNAARAVIAVVLLDYTLWWWHWLSHRVPFLWRFHLVHHVDRDLDASTALRFHFGEHALSFVYRSLQIVVIGAPAGALFVWQLILFASILFHHGNVRLPAPLESVLVRIIVTPRMHGIHHSARREETNSNWSSIVSWWDYLHRTALLGVPQSEVEIGVPVYRDPRAVTIGRILLLPFRKKSDDWEGAIEGRAGRGSPFAA
jgi:sterol desaturase/sphingolipid hydroxylase (fatty acid hydroxylase superfamily)